MAEVMSTDLLQLSQECDQIKAGRQEEALQVFSASEFGQVRVILRNGEPWFVARDIAAAMGYVDPSRAVAEHCKKSIKSTILVDNQHGKKTPLNLSLIPESDVYRLIMRSNLPNAEQFQTWVCEEVLPAIRKTGHYGTGIVLPNFNDPVAAARAWADEREKCEALTAQNETLREVIGCATEWKQVIAIEWLYDMFDMKNPSALQQIGRALSNLSRAMGKEIRRAPHSKYPNGVGVYHTSVVDAFRQNLIGNPALLAAYRVM